MTAAQTRLADMSVTSKTDPRVEAYGDVDEANSAIGVALATGELPDRGDGGARALSRTSCSTWAPTWPSRSVAGPRRSPSSADHPGVRRPARGRVRQRFGDPLAVPAVLHPARRGAGRGPAARGAHRRPAGRTGRLGGGGGYGTEPVADPDRPGGVNPLAITYLNRLSDLLFILTRVVNDDPSGDVLWVPGGSRQRHDDPHQEQA